MPATPAKPPTQGMSGWIEQHLFWWLVASSGLAYVWPIWFASASDPFLATKPVLNYIFAVAMFFIGVLLPPAQVAETFRRPLAVIGGVAAQYITMPLLALLAALVAPLPLDLRIGILLVGCVPGAMASNVLTLAAHGNVSYSVCLTTAATLLSPLIVPVALTTGVAVLGVQAAVSLSAEQGFWIPLRTVVIPVVLGFGCARIPGPQRLWLTAAASPVANLAILWVIAVVVALNRSNLGSVPGSVLLWLGLINGLGYLAGYGAGLAMRLPDSMRRALTLEVGMQNAGLGAVLAVQMFPDRPAIALAPAAYTFGCMLTGTLLANRWGRFVAEDEGDQRREERPRAVQ